MKFTKFPLFVNGNSLDKALETLNYLCRNITSSIEYLMEGQDELEKGMDSLITGERNYSYPYSPYGGGLGCLRG